MVVRSPADVVVPWSFEAVHKSGAGSCAYGPFIVASSTRITFAFPCSSCGRPGRVGSSSGGGSGGSRAGRSGDHRAGGGAGYWEGRGGVLRPGARCRAAGKADAGGPSDRESCLVRGE